MDISVAESSREPSQKQEQVQESSVSSQPVVEEPTFKEADEPGLVKHIGGTAYETPIKTATTKSSKPLSMNSNPTKTKNSSPKGAAMKSFDTVASGEKVEKPAVTKMASHAAENMPPSIDSRTITRPTKKGQVLPEAVVAPVSQRNQPEEAPQMDAVVAENRQQQPAKPVVTATAPATVPLPVVSTAPQATPAQCTSAAPPPQTLKAQPQPPQAVVSSAKATAAVISDVNAVKPQEQAKREEQRTSQRVRQRTVTVHNQLSADIAAAFNEIRQMGVEDPLTEAQRRIQAHMVAKEKEWAAKIEKLSQVLVHEQKKNDTLEQKAAERLMLLGEHEHVIRKLVEELKQQGRKGGKGMSDSAKSFGGPGPERTLSPDDAALLVKERDQLVEEVNSLEASYADLFRRYEKLRQTSIDIKNNEEQAKKHSEELSQRYAVLVEKLEMLRKNAEEQLDL
ncbi:Transforming acidic coiled-coil-containing protein 2 [Toxocara canis]|uniref:Transforming acidic coiled-coil-containing protein 2 n=1 Tax=Toxocara canis TaxID=6265 RepID=A0A0B2VNH7_TOXCA|nr:Transforming acidic coiled-coil-containing protein 2 [Toxocara canis]